MRQNIWRELGTPHSQVCHLGIYHLPGYCSLLQHKEDHMYMPDMQPLTILTTELWCMPVSVQEWILFMCWWSQTEVIFIILYHILKVLLHKTRLQVVNLTMRLSKTIFQLEPLAVEHKRWSLIGKYFPFLCYSFIIQSVSIGLPEMKCLENEFIEKQKEEVGCRVKRVNDSVLEKEQKSKKNHNSNREDCRKK